jgi:hypothetical protein
MSRCNTRSITPPAGKLSLSSGQMLISTTRQQGELVDSLQLCIFQLRSVELQGPYLYLPFVGLPRLRGLWTPIGWPGEPRVEEEHNTSRRRWPSARRRQERRSAPKHVACPCSIRSTAMGRGTTPWWPYEEELNWRALRYA